MHPTKSCTTETSTDSVQIAPATCDLAVTRSAERARHRQILRAIKAEQSWWRRHQRDSERALAQRAARSTEIVLRDQLEQSGDPLSWDPRLARDVQNFAYVFMHREKFSEAISTMLEIVSAKITQHNSNGSAGYFQKLEQNVGWTPDITPIILSNASITDKLVRCGIWSHAKNSRRCHQTGYCPLCLWNDVLKVLVAAFGVEAGAFHRARAWFHVTLSWTTNEANADCRADGYDPAELRPPDGDRGYEPHPVVLGLDDHDPDLAHLGYDDARILGIVMQESVGDLYRDRLIDGYHSKLEGDIRLNPGGANRINFHLHAAVNGGEDNAQFLVESLLEQVRKNLSLFGAELTRPYFPDLHVRTISSPELLEHAITYGEKILPIGHAITDALSRPEARGPDGFFDERFIAQLKVSLVRLLDDDLPAIFTGARLNAEMPQHFNRRNGGNMRFSDKKPCIGREPQWHISKRRKAAARTRASREKKKQELAELRDAGSPVPPRRKSPRRRNNPGRQPPR